ncbi:MAG: caspase family protein, partial [Candidatus Electrothrix sp. ATG2]|nr:caspase family protein [Candidatus Electrothrix sp. ATG2]
MRKLAFIVGMSEYPDDILVNPVNDADAIDIAFKDLGIDTIKKVNIGVADLKDNLDIFKETLRNYEVAIFFFAGHGTEIEGENYLCAIDTDFKSLNRIQYSSLALSYLINLLEDTNIYTKIIILDACRENPFERRLRSAKGSQLAPVFAPLGTIVAYATSPGQLASDGKNENGAYTYSLLQHIYTNDLKIEELFKRTRNTLYALTAKKQLSWEHTSLMGDFYFCNSSLSGNFNSSYSKEAIADSTYNYDINTPVISVVKTLRSCNWDRQNPAIKRISLID